MSSRPAQWLLLLLVGFLIGFLWQYSAALRVQGELSQLRQDYDSCRRQVGLSELRDAISLTYLEAVRKNYSLAGERSTTYFDRLRNLLSESPDPALKSGLDDLISFRDPVTAGLASGDPAVVANLQDLMLKTFRYTQAAGGQADR